jgi:arginyl-tRNA synthetase
MATLWQQWTSDIAKHLSAALGETVEANEVVVPPDTKLGDFAFACFKYAKMRKVSPADLAKELTEKLQGMSVAGMTFVAAGPYVNVLLQATSIVQALNGAVQKQGEGFGGIDEGKSQTVVLEYAQPNTHKETHVGHLRNLAIGVALHRVLQAAGWHVIPASYHGDVGAHVAKCLWWLVRSKTGSVELDASQSDALLSAFTEEEKTASYLGSLYSQSTQQLEAHPEWKDEVSEVQRKLEAHEPAWEKLWSVTREWCLLEMNAIFARLGVQIERQYLESEVVDRGQRIVDDLIAKGVAKESQGAMVVDLEDVKLGVFLVRKSDGTSLYATKDLALAELKLKEYPDANRSLILVDNRQTLYFKQLFETLRRMGLSPVPEFIGYEFVTLKSGAMSSRDGNIVTYQAFEKEVMAYAEKEVRSRHEAWASERIHEVSWALALGGMKFGMLKQDNDKVFTFDMEQALSFEGATGPYCQYAVTRLASILRKDAEGKQVEAAQEDAALVDAAQKALALKIAQLPEKVSLAAKELRPSVIAQWCLEMAQAVSAFYRDVSVLSAEGESRKVRLALVESAKIALSNGLHLLGIPTPEEM